jgi:hypothetical protein
MKKPRNSPPAESSDEEPALGIAIGVISGFVLLATLIFALTLYID